MGIIMNDLRETGQMLKASFAAKVKAGGGRRAIALRYARQQGFNVPVEKRIVKKKRKKKNRMVKTVIIYKNVRRKKK